jgi:hypothetical protein
VETPLWAETVLPVMVELVRPMRFKPDQTLLTQVAAGVQVLPVLHEARVVLVAAATGAHLPAAMALTTQAAVVAVVGLQVVLVTPVALAALVLSSFDIGLRNGTLRTN